MPAVGTKRKRGAIERKTNAQLLEGLQVLFGDRSVADDVGRSLPTLRERVEDLHICDEREDVFGIDELLAQGERQRRREKRRRQQSTRELVSFGRSRKQKHMDSNDDDDDDNVNAEIDAGAWNDSAGVADSERTVKIGTSFMERMKSSSEAQKDDWVNEYERLRVRSFLDVDTDPAPPSGVSDGFLKIKRITQLLDTFKLPDNPEKRLIRSSGQRTFHKAYLEALIPLIYGVGFDRNKAKILKRHGLDKIRYFVLAMTPRRFGKTSAVAMLVAVIAYVLRGVRIVIFSTGKRASVDLMALVIKFLKQLPDGERYICKETNEELITSPVMLTLGKTSRSYEAQQLQTHPLATVIRAYPGGRSAAGIFFELFFLKQTNKTRGLSFHL